MFAVLGATVASCIVTAAPAAAAGAAVAVSPGTADPDYATRLSLRGSGFQSVPNGFGGVYVLFGVVEGAWKPSQGGQSGVGYTYVQDSEQADNNGYQRFVAFPGDPTAAAANGGTLAADGSWSAQLVVPGATFQAAGRDGGVRTIDCRVSQCGVITIGAHGVVNANNETFTPLRFAVPQAQSAPTTPAPPVTTAAPTTSAAPSTSAAAPTTSAPPSSSAAPSTPVTSAPATSEAPSPVAATSDLDSGGTGPWPWLGGGAVLLVLLAVPAVLLLRRRRQSPEEGTTS